MHHKPPLRLVTFSPIKAGNIHIQISAPRPLGKSVVKDQSLSTSQRISFLGADFDWANVGLDFAGTLSEGLEIRGPPVSVKWVGDLQVLNTSYLKFGPNNSKVLLNPRRGEVHEVLSKPFRAQVSMVSALSTREMVSWAWSSGVSIAYICVVSSWSSLSTFARFYYLDVPALQAWILST